jgi:hypothetical protein
MLGTRFASASRVAMSLARYLVGLASIAVAFVPVAFGAMALRRRYLPDLLGPVALLVNVVVSLSIVVVVSEMLGTIGLFSLLPLVVAFASAGLIAWRVGNRGEQPRDAIPDAVDFTEREVSERAVVFGRLAAGAAVALVATEWCVRVVNSLRVGMGHVDALWYHLPIAARFAQSAWTSRLYFVDAHSLIVFYPNTSELLHGLGIVFLGNDTLSVFLNLGWLALALLAAWCVGRPFSVAPLTLMGVALVLATPQFVNDDAGQPLNDVVGLALILAAVAIIVSATRNERRHLPFAALNCAALAAGLALGTKYTLIAPVVVMGIAIGVIAERGKRVARMVGWFAASGLTGGYWYVRNFLTVGNPVPPLRLGLGPLHLPSLPEPGTESPAKFLFDRHVWSVYYLPGLRFAFGPAWWVLVGILVCGGAVGILFGPDRVIRMLGWFAAASFVLFLGSPQVLGNAGGPPIFFGGNLRYAGLAIILSALVLPIALQRFGRRVQYLLYALYLGAIATTPFDGEVWRARYTFAPSPNSRVFVIGALVGAAVFTTATVWIVLRSRVGSLRQPARRRLQTRALACVVAVCVGGFLVESTHLDRRTSGPAISRWARNVHDTRIAIVGLKIQYPLYGKDSSNFVQYIAVRHSDGASTPIPDCATWRRVLNRGRYKFVVVTTPDYPLPSKGTPVEESWMRSDPGARLLIHKPGRDAAAWLYQIVDRLDPAGCA